MNAFVIAAAQKPGRVTVMLKSEFGIPLGEIDILYVDEEKAIVQRVVNEPRLQSKLLRELESKAKTASEGETQGSENLGKALHVIIIIKVFHGSHALFTKAQLNYWLLKTSDLFTSPTKKGEMSGSVISTETNNSIHVRVSVAVRGTSRLPFWARCFRCLILPKTKSLTEAYYLLGTSSYF